MKNFYFSTLLLLSLNSKSYAMDCHGTEPFWGAKVTTQKILVDSYDEKTEFQVASVSAPMGMLNEDEGLVRIYSDERGPLATVISHECNDGMSDNIYPKEILIFTSEGTRYGCCGIPIRVAPSE